MQVLVGVAKVDVVGVVAMHEHAEVTREAKPEHGDTKAGVLVAGGVAAVYVEQKA